MIVGEHNKGYGSTGAEAHQGENQSSTNELSEHALFPYLTPPSILLTGLHSPQLEPPNHQQWYHPDQAGQPCSPGHQRVSRLPCRHYRQVRCWHEMRHYRLGSDSLQRWDVLHRRRGQSEFNPQCSLFLSLANKNVLLTVNSAQIVKLEKLWFTYFSIRNIIRQTMCIISVTGIYDKNVPWLLSHSSQYSQ